MADCIDIGALFKDMYPAAGTRLKRWVVDRRREAAWERDTCPKVHVGGHDDNTGASCRNAGLVPWAYLDHDCCEVCCDLHERLSARTDVAAWLDEKAKRPPIESDRTKLSDEVEPDRHLAPHPMEAFRK